MKNYDCKKLIALLVFAFVAPFAVAGVTKAVHIPRNGDAVWGEYLYNWVDSNF